MGPGINLFHSLKIYQVPTICQALFSGAEDSAVNKTTPPALVELTH